MFNNRPDITTEQRDRVIAKIERLRSADNVRMRHVAARLRYWLAGVENPAQWLALYDCIEQDYIRWRIDAEEAIHHLRWLGMNVSIETDLPFGTIAEMARRASATKLKAAMKARFNAVKWELEFNRRKAAAE
jgi:hypothetical protein